MFNKPNQKDFMHKGVLMKTAYDSAMKAWEANESVTVPDDPSIEEQSDKKSMIVQQLAAVGTDTLPEESGTDVSTSIEASPAEPLIFKIGNTVTWKITPITKDGTAAKIQLKSLIVISKPPSVEVSATGENTFVLIPLEVGSSQLIISFLSTYGKLVTRTYNVTIVDGADEAVDMRVEYTIQG